MMRQHVTVTDRRQWRNWNILAVFDSARRYERALESRDREDGKKGTLLFVLVALLALIVLCFLQHV